MLFETGFALLNCVLLAVSMEAASASEVHQGKVLAVSGASITIQDDRDDENDTFVVTPETKIVRNGKLAALKDIQVGDRAKVTAQQRGSKLVAESISAMAPE